MKLAKDIGHTSTGTPGSKLSLLETWAQARRPVRIGWVCRCVPGVP